MPDRTFLDWPFFEEAHRGLAKRLEAWCGSLPTDHGHHDVDAECRQWVKALAAGGWLNFAAPEPGGSIDARSLCLMRETLARHSGLADFTFAMQGLGSGPIALFGSAEQQSSYLPAVQAGSKIAAFALSEAVAGSDVSAITTSAERKGNEYVLNGAKTWISNAGIADYYIVFARTGEGPGAKGLSAFIVDATNPGLTVTERIEVIAPHPLGTLEFVNCKIPETALIGQPGQGFKIAMATLDLFRPSVGAAALGFARRALDETLQRTTTRKLFGEPMAAMQITQAKLADMALNIDASALLIYRAAWAKDKGAERITREASMAKLYATESAQEVIDMAVQLHGGLGVKSGVPVEQLYREIRALRIYEGASEVQQQIIARQVLAAFQESNP
ncbi:MAG: acyl-CoA dehydrogenase family protein [Armatimonadetes bacterium]|nr:acyl-CoA dehydrogenase family protein [Armatimonadota bacterium]